MTDTEKAALLKFLRQQGDSLSTLGAGLVQAGNAPAHLEDARIWELVQAAAGAVDEEMQRMTIFKQTIALALSMSEVNGG